MDAPARAEVSPTRLLLQGGTVSEENKAIVRRLISEVLNGGRLELLEELYAPELAPAARRWIVPFRASFPDVHMEIVDLIAEGDRVADRFTARPPTRGVGLGTLRLGVASSGSTRWPSSGSATARSSMPGRWRTPSHCCSSSAWPRQAHRDQHRQVPAAEPCRLNR
jgi:hypothetical protein